MLNDAPEMTKPVLHALNRIKNLAKSSEDRAAIAEFARECFKAGYEFGVKDALDGVRLAARGEL